MFSPVAIGRCLEGDTIGLLIGIRFIEDCARDVIIAEVLHELSVFLESVFEEGEGEVMVGEAGDVTSWTVWHEGVVDCVLEGVRVDARLVH